MHLLSKSIDVFFSRAVTNLICY